MKLFNVEDITTSHYADNIRCVTVDVTDISELLHFKNTNTDKLEEVQILLAEDNHFFWDLFSIMFNVAVTVHNYGDDSYIDQLFTSLKCILPSYGFGEYRDQFGETVSDVTDETIYLLIDLMDEFIAEIIHRLDSINVINGYEIEGIKLTQPNGGGYSPLVLAYVFVSDKQIDTSY